MAVVAAGKKAPAFELKNTEGKPIALDRGLANGPVLVAFFKVSCPTCQFTFPFLERLHHQLRGKQVQIWGISQDDARQSQRFAREYGTTFPYLIDEYPFDVSRAYGIKYVPTLFLISPDGQVEFTGDGFCKADLLEIQKWFSRHFQVELPTLFTAKDHVPEFKPG
jgi:peroxiredoxin